MAVLRISLHTSIPTEGSTTSHDWAETMPDFIRYADIDVTNRVAALQQVRTALDDLLKAIPEYTAVAGASRGYW